MLGFGSYRVLYGIPHEIGDTKRDQYDEEIPYGSDLRSELYACNATFLKDEFREICRRLRIEIDEQHAWD